MAEKRTWRSEEVARNDQALLRAAREVVAEDGAHASVASIAARAGVGVGTLYRRYRTKDELFQRLSELAVEGHLAAAKDALTVADPWEGLVQYAFAGVRSGPGSLAAIAGTVEPSERLVALFADSERAVEEIVGRARRAGLLRQGVTMVDVELLIEQFSRSAMVEQFRTRGDDGLEGAARSAHERIVRIALDGLRATPAGIVPGPEPTYDLFTRRWEIARPAPKTHPRAGSTA